MPLAIALKIGFVKLRIAVVSTTCVYTASSTTGNTGNQSSDLPTVKTGANVTMVKGTGKLPVVPVNIHTPVFILLMHC